MNDGAAVLGNADQMLVQGLAAGAAVPAGVGGTFNHRTTRRRGGEMSDEELLAKADDALGFAWGIIANANGWSSGCCSDGSGTHVNDSTVPAGPTSTMLSTSSSAPP